MNNHQNEKDSYFRELKGAKKALPFILTAIALFIAICYLTDESGILGKGVGMALRGLFSYSAYAVPVIVSVQALFYAEDVAKNRVGARLAFSLCALALFSVIEYAVCYVSAEPVFAPALAFKNANCGGFIGTVVGFVFAKLFGCIGTIVIASAILAVYSMFFFADRTGAFGRGVIAVGKAILTAIAKIADRISRSVEKKNRERAELAAEEHKNKSDELMNDPFFYTDNGVDNLTVDNGNIIDPANPRKPEPKPSAEEIERERREIRRQRRAEKPLDLSYGIEDTEKKDVPASHGFEPTEEVKTVKAESHTFESDDAESVFTKDFDPFNFATSTKIATKPSSKATPIEEEIDELDIPRVEKEPTEADKRRAAFEEQRRRLYEKSRLMHTPSKSAPAVEEKAMPKEATAPEKAQTPEENTREVPVATPSADITSSVNTYTSYSSTQTTYTQPVKTVEFTVVANPNNPTPEVRVDDAITYEKPVQKEESAEDIAAIIAEKIPRETPGYARSANEMVTYTKVTPSPSDITADAPENEAAEDESAELIFNDSDTPEQDFAEETSSPSDAAKEEGPVEFLFDEDPNEQAPAQTELEGVYVFDDEEDAAIDTAPEADSTTSDDVHVFDMDDTEDTQDSSVAAKDIADEDAQEPVIVPFTPPTVDDITPAATEEETTLKLEREIIPPVLVSEEQEQSTAAKATPQETSIPFSVGGDEPTYTVIDEIDDAQEDNLESTPTEDEVGENIGWTDGEEESNTPESDYGEISFEAPEDDLSEEDEEESAIDVTEIPEEENADFEEIPPEKQNPDVIKMREMFPFLAPIDAAKESPAAEEKPVENDDLPPFDVDEEPEDAEPIPTPTPEPAPLAVTEYKEEKKKPDYSDYKFPPIDILKKEEPTTDDNSQAEMQENVNKLMETLASFNVTASIKGVDRGPRVTRYEVVPAKGVKVSSILNLQEDIALNLAASSIRMEAPIPGKSAVGIELPNKKSSIVRLRDLLENEEFVNSKLKTIVCIGRDVSGQPVFGDIAKMPHLLIAGATGMGKSVCINSLMISILFKARPDEVKFIMIDPKQVEFTMYNGIPHLLVPVVSDAKQAAGALMWAVEEMERRYNLLNPLCVRNIDAYNEKVSNDPSLGEVLPRIIIVIDEFADLMLQVKDPVENLVMRIAQKARAAGIYLIIGTQRPSVNVITGVIKANIPSRISCKVMSNVDSKTVLDSAGAEKLLDRGDMLYAPAGALKPNRVQGAFVEDGEVEAIMQHLKQYGSDENYDSAVMEEISRAAQKCSKKGGSGASEVEDDDDEIYGEGYLNDRQFLDAVDIALSTRKISTSLIQRKLSIGYGKAAKFIDIMEEKGIVGEANGPRPREVLMTHDQWREILARTMYDN